MARVLTVPLLLWGAWACSTDDSSTGRSRGAGETTPTTFTRDILDGGPTSGDEATVSQFPSPDTTTSNTGTSTPSMEDTREPSSDSSAAGPGEPSSSDLGATAPPASSPTSGASPSVDSNVPPETWTPVDSPRSGLSECTAKRSVTDAECEYELQCKEQLTSAHCDRAADGLWNCSCYDDQTHRYSKYTVSGADQETLCALSVDNLCVVYPGPDQFECSVIQETFSAQNVCHRVERCGTTKPLAPGLEAHISADNILNECEFDGQAAECSCGFAGDLRRIYGVSQEQMCDVVDSVCQINDVQDDRSCAELTQATVTEDDCSFLRRCGYRVDLEQAPGAYALYALSNFGSECRRTNDAVDCECFPGSDPEWSLQFDAQTELADACAAVDAACALRQAPTATGAPLCNEPTIGSQEPTSCVAYTDCVQPGVLNGTPMSVSANLSVECALTPDESWRCYCYSGNYSRSSDFSVDEAATSNVCPQALQYCQDLQPQLELQAGYSPTFTF